MIIDNPKNYQVWWGPPTLTRLCAKRPGRPRSDRWRVPDDWCGSFAPRYHRRAVVEKIGDGSAELELTAEILKEDAKNYHVGESDSSGTGGMVCIPRVNITSQRRCFRRGSTGTGRWNALTFFLMG